MNWSRVLQHFSNNLRNFIAKSYIYKLCKRWTSSFRNYVIALVGSKCPSVNFPGSLATAKPLHNLWRTTNYRTTKVSSHFPQASCSCVVMASQVFYSLAPQRTATCQTLPLAMAKITQLGLHQMEDHPGIKLDILGHWSVGSHLTSTILFLSLCRKKIPPCKWRLDDSSLQPGKRAAHTLNSI